MPDTERALADLGVSRKQTPSEQASLREPKDTADPSAVAMLSWAPSLQALASVLAEADPGTRARAIQRLQRERGNTFVQRVLSGMRSEEDAPEQLDPGTEDLAERIDRVAGSGELLDPSARHQLEEGLEIDLGSVRVHADQEADQLARSVDAVAFTTGSDIFFRQGAYHPGSRQGMHLLAHEATHVVQQAAGPVAGHPAAGGISLSDPADRYERSADALADKMTAWSAERTRAPPVAASYKKIGGVTTPKRGRAIQRCGVRPCDCPAEEALALQRKTVCDEETGECRDEEEESALTFAEEPSEEGSAPQFSGESTEEESAPTSGEQESALALGEEENAPALGEEEGVAFGEESAPAFGDEGETLSGPALGAEEDAATAEQAAGPGDEFTAGTRALAGAGPSGQFAAVGGEGPVAPAERAPQPCPPYTPEEREATEQSGGGVLDFDDGTVVPQGSALLFDFKPSESTVRERHAAFLREIIQRFRLDSLDPVSRIAKIEGFTDCVGFSAGKEASKNINTSIRKQRALSVALFLLNPDQDPHAHSDNIDKTPSGGGALGGPGPGTSAQDRSFDRSVRLDLEAGSRPPEPEIPGPPPPDIGPKLCDRGVASSEWELQSIAGGSPPKIPHGGTASGIAFFLIDKGPPETKHFAVFGGGGIGGGSSLSISIPSQTPFTTCENGEKLCPEDFDGEAMIVGGTVAFGAGISLMKIDLAPKTCPEEINIGGRVVGVGADVAFPVVGKFKVLI